MHGSINNINFNNKIHFLTRVVVSMGHGSLQPLVLEMEKGNYSSTLSILKAIAMEFKTAFHASGSSGGRRRKPIRDSRSAKPLHEPSITIDEKGLDENKDGYITITPINMSLVSNDETPWSILGNSHDILEDGEEYRFKNIQFSKTIKPAFMYCNIVENSYIYGKLSRNLSTIPLSMKD